MGGKKEQERKEEGWINAPAGAEVHPPATGPQEETEDKRRAVD